MKHIRRRREVIHIRDGQRCPTLTAQELSGMVRMKLYSHLTLVQMDGLFACLSRRNPAQVQLLGAQRKHANAVAGDRHGMFELR